MKIHDITLTLSPTLPFWPGDPPLATELLSSIEAGAHANVTKLTMSVHSGTHLDAPRHFLRDGATVDALPLEVLVGPAWVVRIPDEVTLLDARVLTEADIPASATRLLFKTRNSSLWARGVREFQTDFVAIPEDGARWLAARGIRLVGVDYLSVAPYRLGTPTHRVLLQAGVVVVEGLDLSEVEAGPYDLYCLPVKLAGADGAPARAILISPTA
jgi:arylformamidase